MRLLLDIPDDAFVSFGMTEEELQREAKKELALAFYARGFVSLGKAAEMAGASRMQFERWLGEREIERPFSGEELDKEISWGESSGG